MVARPPLAAAAALLQRGAAQPAARGGRCCCLGSCQPAAGPRSPGAPSNWANPISGQAQRTAPHHSHHLSRACLKDLHMHAALQPILSGSRWRPAGGAAALVRHGLSFCLLTQLHAITDLYARLESIKTTTQHQNCLASHTAPHAAAASSATPASVWWQRAAPPNSRAAPSNSNASSSCFCTPPRSLPPMRYSNRRTAPQKSDMAKIVRQGGGVENPCCLHGAGCEACGARIEATHRDAAAACPPHLWRRR